MEDNYELQKLEYFYDVNMRIKDLLVDMAPKDLDLSSNESLISYADRLNEDLESVEYYFNYITDVLFLNNMKDDTNNLINSIKGELTHTPINSSSLTNFYRKRISDMSPLLIKKLNGEVKGNYLLCDPRECIRKSNTINELLHVYHHTVTFSDQILKQVPIVKSEKTCSYGSLNYRGLENPEAEILYNSFINNDFNTPAEVISTKNKIIFMLYDRGHALTFEINKQADGYDINYFIPKLCNIDMINNLQGVNKVSEETNIFAGTTGHLYAKDLNEMISKVMNVAISTPTDEDMERSR